MNAELKQMLDEVGRKVMALRRNNGMWNGYLSSSPISTSVSVFALHLIDPVKYRNEIDGGVRWLLTCMKPEGAWGDSDESPVNMTATLLTYATLYKLDKLPIPTQRYVHDTLNWKSEDQIVDGVLKYYGTDLTFSVPILMMCALAGVISSWKRIPPFPFELATMPRQTFRYLNLPVVSYAIPALIAVGILQHRRRKTLLSPMRELFVASAMHRLTTLQPEGGGFLEAAPLTAFVAMCLAASGYTGHEVTQRAAWFLKHTVRSDGSWPIDTNLAGWVTSLAGRVLTLQPSDRARLAKVICDNQTKAVHPFNGADAGGWGWTNLTGSVPDGDDTSGALVALHTLLEGQFRNEIGHGIRWLIGLQNRDGGMPTFCRGWGKLPFDRSSPDITAHALLAMSLWHDVLPDEIKGKCSRSIERMLVWLEGNSQTVEMNEARLCAWSPLWFGDQDASDERNYVYGVATLMDYLYSTGLQRARLLADRHLPFLLACRNADGGWGGNRGVPSKVTLTAKAVCALQQYAKCHGTNADAVVATAVNGGIDFLLNMYHTGQLFRREPIGLYFSRLWYSEDMYNMLFLLKLKTDE